MLSPSINWKNARSLLIMEWLQTMHRVLVEREDLENSVRRRQWQWRGQEQPSLVQVTAAAVVGGEGGRVDVAYSCVVVDGEVPASPVVAEQRKG